MKQYATGLFWSATLIAAFAQDKVFSASEAKQHIGDTGTVCGSVLSTKYMSSSRGQPTLLELGSAVTKSEFTVLIAGADRGKFGGTPEVEYRDKVICVTGKIRSYERGAQIVATDPKQIDVQGER